MIVIENPYLVEDEEYAYLKAKINVSEDTSSAYMELEKELPKTHWRFYENYPPIEWKTDKGDLWFSVPKKYAEYLCPERSDAFVVAMLWYAIQTHSDIECAAPLSEKLYFGITELLMPAVCKGKYKPIHIIAETRNENLNKGKAVGTGMSCGVDSIYSLEKYTSSDIPESYKLTCLTYFNMGAIFHPNTATNERHSIKDFYDITDKMSEEKIYNANKVAEMANMPLISMKSNLDRDYYRGAYGYTGVYRNCAMVLAAQKFFGRYYCSSAGWPEFFDLSLDEGSEHYETLLCDAFSTESCQFIISDYATRFEKTELISHSKYAMNYLDVCFNFNNCGTCSKCLRTLITLDLLGQIDKFNKVFDVAEYKQNKEKAYVWLLETKDLDMRDDNAVFARDIYDVAKSQNAIPPKATNLYHKRINKRKIRNCIQAIKSGAKYILIKIHLYK